MNEKEVKETLDESADNESAAQNSAPEISLQDLTEQDVKDLQAQAAKTAEYWERLLRERADFENFKKRAARERQDAIKYGNESLLQKLIPVLDNFEMALQAVTSDSSGSQNQSLQQGVSMIYTQLKSALQDAGLEQVDATGQPFDPTFHEAVSQQESNEVPEGHVLQQLRRGYKLKDRLIRPATVIVAKKAGA